MNARGKAGNMEQMPAMKGSKVQGGSKAEDGRMWRRQVVTARQLYRMHKKPLPYEDSPKRGFGRLPEYCISKG